MKNKISNKLINGPVSKKFFLKNKFLGITEYLAKKTNTKNVAMLIYNPILSVSPVTTHLPLKLVTKKINKKIKKVENSQNVLENKKDINLEKIAKEKNKKIKNLSKKRKIELQSYKIIFILKDVDPKDPTAELSSILSNFDVDFEIEKIERILDSKNKSMNKN